MLRLCFCIALLVSLLSVRAQTADSLYRRYMQTMGGSALLFNGPEYEGAYPGVEGSAFWEGGRFAPSLLVYEGVAYHGVPLAYDQVRDEVLIKGFQGLTVRLDNRRVDSFVLGNHRFVSLRGDAPGLPAGIYERLLAMGPVAVYAKRAKQVQRPFEAAGADRIVAVNRYYVQRDNAFSVVENEGDLLRLFANDKDRLRAFWKSNRFSFNADPERFLTQTLLQWSSTTR